MSDLDFLFKPKSVAIVGVSEDPIKLGSVLMSNLIKAGYEGEIYPVNPKYQELMGLKVYPSIASIPTDVDLVCVVVPPQFVKGILEESGTKNVKGAVIITAGFKEVGDEGIKLENEIQEVATKNNIRILGPNCLGAIIPGSKVNVSFAASKPKDGNIAFLSQSGAFCTAILDMSLEKNLGFSHFISFGNKADINENDLIENWIADDSVKVIGGYIEEISAGHKLTEMYTASKAKKPLIILKPGESQEAQKAISSHTGSMAGSIQTFKTAMEQSGIVVATEVNQMFNMMMSFSWSVLPKGNRVAIITNAGGPGIIATDAIMNHGLKMAEISEETKAKIKPFLPVTASLHNPVDVIGDALAERFKAPIDVLIEDENVDAILIILTPQLVTQVEDTAKLIINSAKISKKPIYPVFLGGKYVSFGLQRLYDENIPAFRYIKDAVDVIEAMYKYSNYLSQNFEALHTAKQETMKLVSTGKYKAEVEACTTKETTALPEKLVAMLAEEAGIELPKQVVSTSLEQGLEFAKPIFPVVLKATTDVIAHKTEKKALYLNIASDEDFRAAYTELETMIRTEFNVATPTILIQEQIKAEEEIFIGANRDGGSNVYEKDMPGFGHLIAFGKGGIYTEVYKDINYALVPATRETMLTNLKKTKIMKIVEGARGKGPLALEKLLDVIEAVQKMVLMYPEIESLDINPILLTQTRAVTVDLKIFLKK